MEVASLKQAKFVYDTQEKNIEKVWVVLINYIIVQVNKTIYIMLHLQIRKINFLQIEWSIDFIFLIRVWNWNTSI